MMTRSYVIFSVLKYVVFLLTYFRFVQMMVRGAGEIPLLVLRSFPYVCEVLQLQIFYVSCEEQPTQAYQIC